MGWSNDLLGRDPEAMLWAGIASMAEIIGMVAISIYAYLLVQGEDEPPAELAADEDGPQAPAHGGQHTEHIGFDPLAPPGAASWPSTLTTPTIR